MTTERRNPHTEDMQDDLGVLESTGAIDTVGIGLLGDATAQVPVALPTDEDDDLVDDDVVDGETRPDLVLEADPAAFVREDDGIGRIHVGSDVSDIVIEIPADPRDDVVVAELVEDEQHEAEPEAEVHNADVHGVDEQAEDEQHEAEPEAEVHNDDVHGADEQAPDGQGSEDRGPDGQGSEDRGPDEQGSDRSASVDAPAGDEDRHGDPVPDEDAPGSTASAGDDSATQDHPDEAEQTPDSPSAAQPTVRTVVAPDAYDAPDAEEPEAGLEVDAHPHDAPKQEAPEQEASSPASAGLRAAVLEAALLDAIAPAPPAAAEAVPPSVPVLVAQPVPAPDRPAEEETVTPEPARAAESELAPRRLDQFAERERESADLLTADRLLDPHQLTMPEPEGLWSHLLYTLSGRRINIGDGRKAKERKALNARIAAPLPGTARFVPVLSRKGGVGKTTVTALLGMALADAREDRVIAVDANPDRGTLADRIARTHGKTVRDLVRIHDQVTGYHDISAVVSRDGTRLDVLASDADPRVSEAFSDVDYEQVASVAAHYYSLVLTDTGTGIVHSVMGATLERADTLVVVAGLSVDEARLASETLTWLEANGYGDKVRDAVVVLNQSTPGTPMVRLDELEAHFRTRVAHVLRIPYDSQIAAGSAISFPALRPETRQAARELAALVVEGLRAQAA